MSTAANFGHVEPIRLALNGRVMEAIARIADPSSQRATIIGMYRSIGDALLAKFGVTDLMDIPRNQVRAACEFVDAAFRVEVK
jgi:hypothetical protein